MKFMCFGVEKKIKIKLINGKVMVSDCFLEFWCVLESFINYFDIYLNNI